jgi:excisionase family DNA binding protein
LHPPEVRSAGQVQRTVVISGLQSNAGVAFLVSESREVMNVRQASQYLGISPDTLYRYITEGEIPAFKLGNRWKLRKTILDRWMERKMSQATARRR